PEDIVRELDSFLSKKKIRKPLKGKKILINAGPTRESLDPVRFISNHSSGKMGIALADAAASYGAEVQLVLGPVGIQPADSSVIVTNVTNAAEMAAACSARFSGCDIAILAAAVADFTPETVHDEKIKKNGNELILRLKPTTDIASELGRTRKKGQFIVGFALETSDGVKEAAEKLRKKNMDMIVLNTLSEKGAGFGHDTNRITIIDRNNNIDKFELKSKTEVAKDILDRIILMTKNLS
ncbi:MAG: bifunctional phosphopantothenoylcysteine decarboxylase/phosphopantothenate--cysteine ligase CoaBC, partial [Chloroflexota bacterium]